MKPTEYKTTFSTKTRQNIVRMVTYTAEAKTGHKCKMT